MATSSATSNGASNGNSTGVSLQDIRKTNTFTTKLPPDPSFPTPSSSHNSPRDALGPRLVKGALYTYVCPEPADHAELLGVSHAAMRDIGLRRGEEETKEFQDMLAGNKMYWDEKTEQRVYPWAQCYGGWQFGSWAGQLGDGRAISLFESHNPTNGARYEIQLKGAGRTPYSRFADGKAVLRSSIREYIVSEALNGLRIPTTRALALTLLPQSKVVRERIEPGAIVTRFAPSWLRIGTFDILRARADRKLIRQLADYVAMELYFGWDDLPSQDASHNVPKDTIEGEAPTAENRYARLYRAICRANARTVAAWQAHGFTNGVLNTDNTSLLGLSLDFGPFAFLDNFDPSYTPNHDDHMLRYSYKNQPSIIWWNLVRLGESLGELLGSGPWVDDPTFVSDGVQGETQKEELISRAETLIERAGEEYKAVFLAEYKTLMRARLGLKTDHPNDFDELFSNLLDTMEACELDFNLFFRRLSDLIIPAKEIRDSDSVREEVAGKFFHKEGIPRTASVSDEAEARRRVGGWLERWAERVVQDWSDSDEERRTAMRGVNPKFIPRGWILDEIIRRVEKDGERDLLKRVMRMAEDPFRDSWGSSEEEKMEEGRWCGDVPRTARGMQCSCSS